MIKTINFFGQINPRTYAKAKSEYSINSGKCDCFVKSQLSEKTLQYAKEKIIKEIDNNGVEYSLIISPTGEILSETRGDKESCKVDSGKILPNAILMHGHPKALPLSSGDIAILLASDAKSQEAVTRDGKSSKLSKQEAFRVNKDYNELYFELERQLCLMALDRLGIDYRINSDDIEQMGRDCIQYLTGQMLDNESKDEIFERLAKFGISTEKSPEQIAKDLKKLMYYQLLLNPHKYDKEHNSIIENYQLIQDYLDTAEGIQTRHDFLKKVAEIYNLNYETNL